MKVCMSVPVVPCVLITGKYFHVFFCFFQLLRILAEHCFTLLLWCESVFLYIVLCVLITGKYFHVFFCFFQLLRILAEHCFTLLLWRESVFLYIVPCVLITV